MGWCTPRTGGDAPVLMRRVGRSDAYGSVRCGVKWSFCMYVGFFWVKSTRSAVRLNLHIHTILVRTVPPDRMIYVICRNRGVQAHK
jgi:hypothetical protein